MQSLLERVASGRINNSDRGGRRLKRFLNRVVQKEVFAGPNEKIHGAQVCANSPRPLVTCSHSSYPPVSGSSGADTNDTSGTRGSGAGGEPGAGTGSNRARLEIDLFLRAGISPRRAASSRPAKRPSRH